MSEEVKQKLERMYDLGVLSERKRIDSAFKSVKRSGYYVVKAVLPTGVLIQYPDGVTEEILFP